MAYRGVVPTVAVNEELNNANFDVKKALRISQAQINELVSEIADPNKDLVIDGNVFHGPDKTNAAATVALNNKLESLSNQSTSIIGVFQQLYQLEKTLGQ